MDWTLPLAAAGLLLGSILLSGGVERLIRRIGAGPADPADRSRGARDLLERLVAWQRERASKHDR